MTGERGKQIDFARGIRYNNKEEEKEKYWAGSRMGRSVPKKQIFAIRRPHGQGWFD